jgi:hypothetical protein
MSETRNPIEAVTATFTSLGVRATLRQLASAAAITWGARTAINQAAEAQEQVTAASLQLAELGAQIEAAEARLAETHARLRDVVAASQPALAELVGKAVESGDFDDQVIERYAAISAETAPKPDMPDSE